MTSPSAARTPDETHEEALAGDGPRRSWPVTVVGGLATGVAFLLGATLVYHAILAALLRVR